MMLAYISLCNALGLTYEQQKAKRKENTYDSPVSATSASLVSFVCYKF